MQSNGETKEPIVSKIFDNSDFGYRKITIERPLRLRFQMTPEAIDALCEATPFQNLAKSKKKDKKIKEKEEQAGRLHQQAITALLETLDADSVWMDRGQFLADVSGAAQDADVKLSAPLKKAIVAAFGQRDENAEICRDKDGNIQPDTELRDYEYVPLKQCIQEYFDREVKPHVPDAWIDESKRDEQDGEVGIVGYEIPLNRHFYVYQPPRPLEEIESEIADLERAIVAELKEVVA